MLPLPLETSHAEVADEATCVAEPLESRMTSDEAQARGRLVVAASLLSGALRAFNFTAACKAVTSHPQREA